MPRKGENIFKRKDGRWEGRYIKDRDLGNKAVYGYLYGKSYTEVKQKLEQVKSHKNDSNNLSVTFAKLSEKWLENKKLCVKASTLAHYKMIIDKHILPLLGRYDISSVNADIIQQYMNKLIIDGYATKTASDILNVIKSILKYAEHKSFCHNCDLSIISLKKHKSEIEILTLFEQKKLCNYIENNLNSKNLGILLCLYTGIRIGELCALKWSDIDIRERVLSVNKTMLRVSNNYSPDSGSKTKITITPPKSENSVRNIPIPRFIIDMLKNFKRNSNAYVLTNSTDNFIEPRNLQYYFKAVLKKCGIRSVKFHVLRHTFATRCIVDENTGISVTTNSVAEFNVENLTDSDSAKNVNSLLDKSEKLADLYDISLTKDGISVQPDEPTTVKIPTDNENAKVYRIEDNGTATDMNAVYDNGYMVFTTDHFSLYALVVPNDNVIGDVNRDGEISIADATEIQMYLAEISSLNDEQLSVADVNDDGKISILDATVIQEYLAELIPSLR